MNTNKVVLITGASSGMGKETAILLSKNGFIVYAAARRLEKLEQLKLAGIRPIEMDVTDDATMKAAVDSILKEQKRIDVLINSAGFGSYGALEDVSMEEARRQLEVNVIGAARLAQLVLPTMRAQHSGKIINITSVGGKIATPFGAWYHASKFALEGLSDSLRNEVKPFGVDVIIIEPGGIKSEWGSIAVENLKKTTAHSVYKKQAEAFGQSILKSQSKNPEPIVIAKLIYKAISDKKPAIRYTAGYLAKPSLFMRKIMSDKMMDKMVASQLQQFT